MNPKTIGYLSNCFQAAMRQGQTETLCEHQKRMASALAHCRGDHSNCIKYMQTEGKPGCRSLIAEATGGNYVPDLPHGEYLKIDDNHVIILSWNRMRTDIMMEQGRHSYSTQANEAINNGIVSRETPKGLAGMAAGTIIHDRVAHSIIRLIGGLRSYLEVQELLGVEISEWSYKQTRDLQDIKLYQQEYQQLQKRILARKYSGRVCTSAELLNERNTQVNMFVFCWREGVVVVIVVSGSSGSH